MGLVLGPGKVDVTLRVNGLSYDVYIEPRQTLLDVLRDELHLTGTKKVCNQGECGACSVMIDGALVYSCLTLAIACPGREIQTIESIKHDERLQKIQKAFIEEDGYQCGFCTPGQMMAVNALLSREPNPDMDAIKRGVAGNLCRCGAYPKIFKAAVKAACATALAASPAAATQERSEANG